MNAKLKVTLAVAGIALGVSACSGGGNDYLPDPTAADYSTMNTVVLAHPGQECVMEWGNGVYVTNCYPMGYTLPYSVHIYYPRSYCGCWHVASRPANYRPVYVNKTTYQKTVINKQTTVNVNKTGSGTTRTTSNSKTPQDAVPKGYTPRSSGSTTRTTTTTRTSSSRR